MTGTNGSQGEVREREGGSGEGKMELHLTTVREMEIALEREVRGESGEVEDRETEEIGGEGTIGTPVMGTG